MSDRTAPVYRPEVDGLRAIAVLLVLFYHFGVPGFAGGFIGVDVFFVISGYLITGKIVAEMERGTFSFSAFYLSRARRLFPALAAALAVSTLLALALVDPENLVAFSKSAVASLLFVSNLYFLANSDYFAPASHTAPLLHTWSLSIEEQFYLVWPLAIVAVWSRKGRFFTARSLVLAALASIVAAAWVSRTDPRLAFYCLPFRLGEFVVGALVVSAERSGVRLCVAENVIFAAGLVVIATCGFGLSRESAWSAVEVGLACLGAGAILHAARSARLSVLLQPRWLVAIGRCSYSVYLIHWPLWVFLGYARIGPASPALTGLAVAASLALGWASYRWIEQPFRRVSPHPPAKQHGFVAGCALVATALLLTGFVGWRAEGLPQRLAKSQQITLERALQRPDSECTGHPIPEFSCVSIGPSAPDDWIYLIGDSHSAHFRSGLIALLGDRYRIASSVANSCLPVFGLDVVQNGSSVTGCRARNDALRRALPRDSVVVLAARWSLYLFGTPVGLEQLPSSFVLSKDGMVDPARAAAWLESGLDETVAALVDRGNKVVLLGQVPPVGNDPLSCLLRPGLLVPADVRHCQPLERSEIVQRLATSDAVVARVAERHGVLALLVSKHLCSKGETHCRILGPSGELLYRDDDHLSTDGSRHVIRLLRDELERYLVSEAVDRRPWSGSGTPPASKP